MNIAVIGASGRSGKAFIEEALSAGHAVRAGIYSTNNLTNHERLQIFTCNAMQYDDIRRLIRGAEVVVSLIGHVKHSPDNLQTEAIKVLCEAMKKENISRCISLTGTGVRFAGDKITFIDRLLNASVQLIDPARIQDGKNYVAFLQQSDFNWTVIRVLKLQNIAPRSFQLTKHGPTKPVVGRREVARAILQVIEQNTFVKEAPMISRSTMK